jgi:hypothetical protein
MVACETTIFACETTMAVGPSTFKSAPGTRRHFQPFSTFTRRHFQHLYQDFVHLDALKRSIEAQIEIMVAPCCTTWMVISLTIRAERLNLKGKGV